MNQQKASNQSRSYQLYKHTALSYQRLLMSIPGDQYVIRRNPDGGFIWTPSEESRELRDALALKYPEIIGYRAKMKEALKEFVHGEKGTMFQAQSSAGEHSESAHDSSMQQNLSLSSLDRKKIKGGRKGPLNEEGKRHFRENYGKACQEHRKSRTKTGFTYATLRNFIDTCSAIRKNARTGCSKNSRLTS